MMAPEQPVSLGEALLRDFGWTTVIGMILSAALVFVATRKKDAGTMALEIAREAREEVSDLKARLDAMENKLGIESDAHAKTKRKLHLLEEKYSAAIAFIISLFTLWAGLKVRLDRAKFEHSEPPQMPDLIAADYHKAIEQDE